MLVTWYLVLSNAEFATRNTWLENAKSAPSTRVRRRKNYMRSAVEERHQAASHVGKWSQRSNSRCSSKADNLVGSGHASPPGSFIGEAGRNLYRDGEWEFLALRAA